MSNLKITRTLQNYFFVLYVLAALGARERTVKLSTKFLAEKLNLSQQTLSRYLINLEHIGWIRRVATREGSFIHITNLGDLQLRRVRAALNSIFEEKSSPILIEGIVFSGLGEGAYYVTRGPYRRQFIEKLGFDPYPGTLNLKLTSEYDIQMRRELEVRSGIEIHGFSNADRTYGPVKCFPARINGEEKGAVILALRTHYSSSVIEVIAPKCLRDVLGLRDGDRVRVEVSLEE